MKKILKIKKGRNGEKVNKTKKEYKQSLVNYNNKINMK